MSRDTESNEYTQFTASFLYTSIRVSCVTSNLYFFLFCFFRILMTLSCTMVSSEFVITADVLSVESLQ